MTAEIEREQLECDVLIVGGGSAGLSAAYHLQTLIEKHNQQPGSQQLEPMIVVLEKGSEVGAHSLSGAVINPIALKEMIPDFITQGCPLDTEVLEDSVYYLGEKLAIKSPLTPPNFQNKGNYIASISKVNKWLGGLVEEKGVNVFPGFSAVECLYDEAGRVTGVRTGDRGRDKNGEPKANFEPGMLIHSKITIFADGTNSPLFKHVDKKLGLSEGKNPRSFELGCKEIIQLPQGNIEPGRVIHTLGFPLKKSVGGTFIYTLPDDRVIVGLMAYLDTEDPLLDVHRELQKLKTHPFLKKMLKGGKVIAYGGKTLPAGGWFSMPKLYHDGMMVCGDAACMVDVKKLKGVHLAMKAGMLAAETALEALIKNDFSEATLKAYSDRVKDSFIGEDLWKTRNFHQALSQGMVAAGPELALQEITGGRGLVAHRRTHLKDHETTAPVLDVWGVSPEKHPDNQLPPVDGEMFFDRLGSVYMTGTTHDEDSPNHLLLKDPFLCSDYCAPKYNSPCNHFCPAKVYEMVPDENRPGHERLQINYTNCIHCQTCDLKCPTDNIDWTLPEGGGGPNYTEV